MKRKLLYPIAVMASLALALTACGGSQTKESAKEGQTIEQKSIYHNKSKEHEVKKSMKPK